MANTEHVNQLREGVDAWNKWRKKNRHISPDLSGTEFHWYSIFNLSGANLSGANLSEVYASGANFSKANLSKTSFIGTDLSKANLKGANLSEASLSGANLSEANLSGVNLRGAKLNAAKLNGVNLSEADLSGFNFSGFNLSGINLSGADLSNAILIKANLRETNLSGADLRGAKLNAAKLSGVNLSRTDLSGFNFNKFNLSKANLSRTNLNGANLHQTNLVDAILDGATLTGAQLWETQRTGWSIKGVICDYAYWDREANERTEYAPGEFERAFAEKRKIVLRYPGGMKPIDLMMLPLALEQLQAKHEGCVLQVRSIQDEGGGAAVEITVDDTLGRSAETFQKEVGLLQSELEDYRRALSKKNEIIKSLEQKYDHLKNEAFPLFEKVFLDFLNEKQKEIYEETGKPIPRSTIKVFLSSTGRDLQDYRDAAHEIIHQLDNFHCIWMEDFGATNNTPIDLCIQQVKACDVFIGIAGHCYGSCPPDDTKSFTEYEYDAAVEKPRLMFIAPNGFSIPNDLIEPDEIRQRQQQFRQRIMTERVIAPFDTPENLATRIAAALSNWRDKQLETNST